MPPVNAAGAGAGATSAGAGAAVAAAASFDLNMAQTLFEHPNTWTSFGYGFYFRLFLLCCVDEVDGFNALFFLLPPCR